MFLCLLIKGLSVISKNCNELFFLQIMTEYDFANPRQGQRYVAKYHAIVVIQMRIVASQLYVINGSCVLRNTYWIVLHSFF